MSYEVVWEEECERQLVEMWIAARDQQSITEAANHLDAALRNSPHQVCESRSEGFRIAHQAPVGILCHVDDANETVRVVRVWHY